ncbi:MAG: phosphoribosylaminoimidazolesuccinocarboxamide synthase [Chthoniobacteraceae bacterium]|jgi:phosphoribosylaminoimidazole-succinocarboxamide synthase
MEISSCELPGIPKLRSGKVREIFDLGDCLLFVATDRISAFDCIMPDPIPGKGAVLTGLSAFWFRRLDFVENHVLATRFDDFPKSLAPFREQLEGRSMIVKKAAPLPVECVVRGFLAGSGWKEYVASESICGQPVPPGLRQADALPRTMFTPSTKAEAGHDENITWDDCRRILGDAVAEQVRGLSIRLYEAGRDYARDRGIIVADTKFEFGLLDGRVILIDEVLTPDSSRFWPADRYQPGFSPPSFDKQYLRDYLDLLDWDKRPPAPKLPPEVVRQTARKYREAYERLTGESLPHPSA